MTPAPTRPEPAWLLVILAAIPVLILIGGPSL